VYAAHRINMLIAPNWHASPRVHAAMTTREGGVSAGAYASMNLGYATDDDRNNVRENESRVAAEMGIDADDIRWAYQIHGNVVHNAENLPVNNPLGATEIQGDAIVSHTLGLVCGIKIADCMPVLFASMDGDVVAAAHAGWRGLCGGVLENTVAACDVQPERLIAWCGPCIGPLKFEVGEEVRDAFVAHDTGANVAFKTTATPGKFLCDLPMLAMQRLHNAGVRNVAFSNRCTVSEPDVFFSHRRDRVSGRMAAFVWIKRS
jgi:polyphenol oxidase